MNKIKIPVSYKIIRIEDRWSNHFNLIIKYKLPNVRFKIKIDTVLDTSFRIWFQSYYGKSYPSDLSFVSRYDIVCKIIQDNGIEEIIKMYIQEDINKRNKSADKDMKIREIENQLSTNWKDIEIELK